MTIKDLFKRSKVDEDNTSTEAADKAQEASKRLPVDRDRIKEAYRLLSEYKRGKAQLEAKIIENEKWYRARHWECIGKEDDEIKPASAWLFNVLANKHASAMDNFPSPNILAREEQDRDEADVLSSIVPVILDGCNFEETYDEANHYKGRTGACCYAVLWNHSLHNGLGDVDIKHIDLLNLFWEPGITDIQKSRNLFHVELCDNDLLEMQYPQLRGKLGGNAFHVAEYRYDESINTANKSAVIDWYYKVKNGTKDVLHYVKFVSDTVIFASENDQQYADGWYLDGRYPFEFDVLFPAPGSPAGFGYVDIGKNTQMYIDQMSQSILENGLWSAKPRYFAPVAGNVNEKEFLNRNNSLVHYTGNGDGIIPIQTNTLPSICYQIYEGKINELKETTGNRDVNTGGASGVTAASAIAAMQEAGSRLDRDDIKASYRAYKGIVTMVIERIRQFYDLPRYFRVLGTNGMQKFINYSNANLQMQATRFDERGQPISYRLPCFDVEVVPQKQSPYSKLANNELYLEFFNRGFFSPQLADQALACLELMDFDRKSFAMEKIAQNGTLYTQLMATQQQLIGMAAELDRIKGTQMAPQLAAQMKMGAPMMAQGGGDVELDKDMKESTVTANARKRVAESTSPT